MKKYKHNILGREAIQARSDDVRIQEILDGKYDIIHKGQTVNNKRLAEEELIAMGFEEVTTNDTAYNGMFFGEDNTNSCFGVRFSHSMGKYEKKLMVIYQIRQRSVENDHGYKPDWSDDEQKKYRIFYCYRIVEWVIDLNNMEQHNFSLPYFFSKAKAQQCIDHFGDELNVLLDD